MKLFLDTSSLIKLYYKEDGTEKLDSIFSEYLIQEIFLSEISITEFYSAVYKKIRTKDLTRQNANDILAAFNYDRIKYAFVGIDSTVIELSKKLIEKYGSQGLRTLDAIQFASLYKVRNLIDAVVSNDKLLNSFLISDGFKIL